MCIGMANGGKTPKMTPQEAMKLVEECGLNIEGIANIECESVIFYALEKQIPKKPIEDVSKDYEGNIIDDVFFCPKCTRTICFGCETDIKENYPYCNCGQKIDWSDTE
jgi:hypothetical protein